MVTKSQQLQVVGAVEMDGHPKIVEDASFVAGCGELGVAISDLLEVVLQDTNLLIDFTYKYLSFFRDNSSITTT